MFMFPSSQVSTLSQPSKEKEEANAKTRSATRTVRKQAVFASEETVLNPYSDVEFDPAKVESFSLRKSSKGNGKSYKCSYRQIASPTISALSNEVMPSARDVVSELASIPLFLSHL
jgi:hypothetical protein